MAYANGRLPESALARIPGTGPYGGPKLRKDAASAYNAMHQEAMRRWGISMALQEASVGQSYRSYQRQVHAKNVYGRNAATPGTSNHGLGLAVDLENRRQRWVVDQIGAKYGFSKRCSDASWEWWHIKYNPGCTGASYKPSSSSSRPTLREGKRGPSVKRLQRYLRALGFQSVPVKGNKHGYFGKSTKSAVIRFQRKHKLKADGIVGASTWRALERAVKK